METVKRVLKNDYIQTMVMIILVIVIVFGLWFGSQFFLHSQYPALAVASGSMCKLPGAYCDGWTHPFERTLHVGDLIIVQGVKPEEIHVGKDPEGDIIVFRQGPDPNSELIVHRAVEARTVNGTVVEFVTKGDGNSGPDSPIPVDRVIGKVVLRISWIGHLALLMRYSSTMPFLVLLLIIIVVIIEVVIPSLTRNKRETPPTESPTPPSTT